MSAINGFVTRYGTNPWLSIIPTWAGTATVFRLYANNVLVYTGTALEHEITTTPGQRYDLRLEGDLSGHTTTVTGVVFARPLPAPQNLAAASITASAATLSWDAVAGADSYEIADVLDSYNVIWTGTTLTHALSGLTARSRYSYAVRTVKGAQKSRWSAPATFTTPAQTMVTAGAYDFGASSIGCWMGGVAGVTSPAWRAATDDWFHGEGAVWGDNSGVQSTWFFFGAVNPFAALAGGTVTKVEVYLTRADYGGDPAAVLSRLSLHTYTTQPGGEPVTNGTSYDVGELARGESAWVEVPNGWGTALIAGSVKGIAWGPVAERYQISRYSDPATNPRMGDVRITVS